MELRLISSSKCFEGKVEVYEHDSRATQSPMRFSIYLPPQAATRAVPVVYWLSGLTCNEDNFMNKSGAQKYAAQLGLALVAPDTSPRKTGIPGEDADWEVGSGASFYVNATQAPWSKHFRMEDYVVSELPEVVEKKFPVIPGKRSLSGHSMGGHGALVLSLRNPGKYLSVSAFAPITTAARNWGSKAFTVFLGKDESAWEAYDATCLVRKVTHRMPFLVDQGLDDSFLKNGRLLPQELLKACREVDYPIQYRSHAGYDHGYYFISTFIESHLKYHAEALG